MSRKELAVRSVLFAFLNLFLTRFLGGLEDSNLLVTIFYIAFMASFFALFMTLFNKGIKKND